MDGFLSITHPLTLATVFHTAYSTISADGRKVPRITLGSVGCKGKRKFLEWFTLAKGNLMVFIDR